LTHRFKPTKMSAVLVTAMRSAVAIVSLAFAVSGCGITDKTYNDLTRSGRGIDQLSVDGANCDMALLQSHAGQPAEAGANVGLTLSNVGAQMIEQDNFFDSCMLSRGWQRQ
jgi:hypothetical protein